MNVALVKKKTNFYLLTKNLSVRAAAFFDLTAICWIQARNFIFCSRTLEVSGWLEWFPKCMHEKLRYTERCCLFGRSHILDTAFITFVVYSLYVHEVCQK